MSKSSKIFTALVGIGGLVAALSLADFQGSARAEAGSGAAAERIAAAFAAAPISKADPAIQLVASRAAKGDLLRLPACSGQEWPNIAADCLLGADGRAVRPARSVTVGYQVGASTTVLIRMPAPQVAAR